MITDWFELKGNHDLLCDTYCRTIHLLVQTTDMRVCSVCACVDFTSLSAFCRHGIKVKVSTGSLELLRKRQTTACYSVRVDLLGCMYVMYAPYGVLFVRTYTVPHKTLLQNVNNWSSAY